MSRNRERLNEPGTIVVFFNNIFIFHIEPARVDSVPELPENSNGILPTVWVSREKHRVSKTSINRRPF